MVLSVLSVMGGWLDMVKTHARGLLGDVVIDNHDHSGFPLYQEFIDDITTWKDAEGQPLIAKATPVLYSWGLFKLQDYLGTARVSAFGSRRSSRSTPSSKAFFTTSTTPARPP